MEIINHNAIYIYHIYVIAHSFYSQWTPGQSGDGQLIVWPLSEPVKNPAAHYYFKHPKSTPRYYFGLPKKRIVGCSFTIGNT